MISLLSPAKSLDFTSPAATNRTSAPRFDADTETLVAIMAGVGAQGIARLMKVSQPLAELNAARYRDWDEAGDDERAAILAFDGDVYRGLDAPATFDDGDYLRAQETLRILSGLYGLLRPFDTIRPYRLEMGTKLATDRGETLYDFWGSRITDMLRDDVDQSPGEDVVVNLASREYFSAVDAEGLNRRVVAPVFLDAKGDGPPKIVSFHAKKARGAMAGWMVRNGIDRAADLTHFEGIGYRFDPEASTEASPVFMRRNPA